MVLEDGQEVRLQWPSGYSAQFRPFVVFDDRGREVARDGDRLQAGRDGPHDGSPDQCGRASPTST